MDSAASLFLPPQASTIAGEVDGLIYFLTYLSIFFMILIYGGTAYLAIKYRRKGKRVQLTSGPSDNHKLELTWTIIPTIIVLIIFVWGFKGYMKMSVVPANSMEIKVTGQKWFWTFEYPGGVTTVNELVAPINKPVKLLMSSQDVIHSFFVPAFRVKLDVLPNRYMIAWFEAISNGEFDLFCTEYCGKGHSEMLAKVKIMPQDEFEEWLSSQGFDPNMPPEERGEKLFTSRACNTCHSIDGSKNVGPTFKEIFGSQEKLASGGSVTVDENYMRESMLLPQAKVAKGFDPVMPTFEGILNDQDIDDLIAYIKTLQ